MSFNLPTVQPKRRAAAVQERHDPRHNARMYPPLRAPEYLIVFPHESRTLSLMFFNRHVPPTALPR